MIEILAAKLRSDERMRNYEEGEDLRLQLMRWAGEGLEKYAQLARSTALS